MIDAAGLQAPGPDWTYQDFVRYCRALTVKAAGKPPRFGASLFCSRNVLQEDDWLLRGFGGSLMDAARTRCILHSPAASNFSPSSVQ